jgi:hypothetical protein
MYNRVGILYIEDGEERFEEKASINMMDII